MPPILQLALDFVDLHRAVNVAQFIVGGFTLAAFLAHRRVV